MAGEINLYDSDGVKQRKIAVDDTTKRVEIRDATGTDIMDIEAHASRHGYGGDDAIPDNALRFAQIDKVFGSETAVTVDAGATATIDKGIYYVRCGANTKVEYSPDGGTTWVELIAAGGVGLVISDGSNVRLNNGGTAAEDSHLLPIQ